MDFTDWNSVEARGKQLQTVQCQSESWNIHLDLPAAFYLNIFFIKDDNNYLYYIIISLYYIST